MGRNRTCVLFACVTAACACSSKQAMSGGEAGEEAKAAESVPRWAIAAEDVVEAPEQDALLGLVTAVRTPARVRICTATPIGPRTVLTAAHCIAGDRAVFVADGREVGSSDVMRACQSGRCSEAPVEPAPGHESEFTRSDLATAALVPMATPFTVRPMDLIAMHAVDDGPVDAFMVSTARPHPLLVCRVRVVNGEGAATGEIELGDSGSPLMLVGDGDRRGVIGVVSRRIGGAGRWFFSPLDELPWPELDHDPQPELAGLTFAISPDPRCH